jgi:hypothetical protein
MCGGRVQEKPDAILPTMGGQTALNLAKALSEVGGGRAERTLSILCAVLLLACAGAGWPTGGQASKCSRARQSRASGPGPQPPPQGGFVQPLSPALSACRVLHAFMRVCWLPQVRPGPRRLRCVGVCSVCKAHSSQVTLCAERHSGEVWRGADWGQAGGYQ